MKLNAEIEKAMGNDKPVGATVNMYWWQWQAKIKNGNKHAENKNIFS